MRFLLVDRVLECEPGRKLVAVKNLSLAEEYLADHFPGSPVFPGALMVEALTQAGAWLVRETEGHAHSMITLRSAKGIKFGQFVTPGSQLRLEVELTDLGPTLATLKAQASVGGANAAQGRLVLTRTNLRENNPQLAELDRRIVEAFRAARVSLFPLERTAPPAPQGPSTEGTPDQAGRP